MTTKRIVFGLTGFLIASSISAITINSAMNTVNAVLGNASVQKAATALVLVYAAGKVLNYAYVACGKTPVADHQASKNNTTKTSINNEVPKGAATPTHEKQLTVELLKKREQEIESRLAKRCDDLQKKLEDDITLLRSAVVVAGQQSEQIIEILRQLGELEEAARKLEKDNQGVANAQAIKVLREQIEAFGVGYKKHATLKLQTSAKPAEGLKAPLEPTVKLSSAEAPATDTQKARDAFHQFVAEANRPAAAPASAPVADGKDAKQ